MGIQFLLETPPEPILSVKYYLCGEYYMIKYKLNSALSFRVWKTGSVRLIPRNKVDIDQEAFVMYLHTYIHTYIQSSFGSSERKSLS